MDYKEKYEQAINRAKKELDTCGSQGCDTARQIFRVFPELKESEDEKIRKELIIYLYNELNNITQLTPRTNEFERWIAWLEKHGEPKLLNNEEYQTVPLEIPDRLYASKKELEKPKQYEQKPTDKVEPKFHVGDWVVHECGEETAILQIARIEEDYYVFSDDSTLSLIDEDALRLWDITKDAKDCDVLADEYNNICIYKEIEGICWHSYIYVGCDGCLYGFSIGGSHMQNNTKPATQGQRDILFKKMKEAGYEFDFDKKELKKIEHSLVWGEENEDTIKFLISHFCVSHYNRSFQFTSNKLITHDELLEKIRNLRPHSTWKPSDEQMTQLKRYCPDNRLLTSLYEQLKKLKA